MGREAEASSVGEGVTVGSTVSIPSVTSGVGVLLSVGVGSRGMNGVGVEGMNGVGVIVGVTRGGEITAGPMASLPTAACPTKKGKIMNSETLVKLCARVTPKIECVCLT